MITDSQIRYIKENFLVDIIHNENGYLHAYIHKNNERNNYSFHIQASPEMVFYYGDIGTFVFKKDGQVKMLQYFNQKDPNYWKEHCIAGQTEEYDIHTAKRSLLEIVASELDLGYDDDDSNEHLFALIKNKYKRFKEYSEKGNASDFEDVCNKDWLLYNEREFDEAYKSLEWEYSIGIAIEFLNKRYICTKNFPAKKITDYFELCLWNLSIFTGKILELIEE